MLAARRRRILLTVTALVVGCGEAAPPAPAAAPEEFDDPFAETEAAPVEPAEASPATEQVVAAAERAAAEGADAPAPAAEGPPEAAEPARGTAKKRAGAESPASKDGSAATSERPVSKDKPAATPEVPAPKDSSPTPAPPAPKDIPAPAPAPAPAPVPAPASAPTPAPEQARFAGTFRYAGGEAQRQSLASAIEAAAQQLNALIRPVGRKRLTEANPIREQIAFAVDGDRVTATFAAGRTVTGTLGGPAVAWTSDSGKPLKVAFSLVKGRLVMDFKSDDGSRRSTFTLDESGAKLTMSVTITSERLTSPLKYALTYRRA